MARVETHACPNCGGALGVPARHDQFFRCSYCGSVLEDTTHQEPTTVLAVARPPASVDATRLAAYAASGRPAARTGCGAGVAVGAATLLVGIVVLVVILARHGAGGGGIPGVTETPGLGLSSFTSSAVLPSDDETGPDLVTMGYEADSQQRLFYVDLDADEPVRWSVAVEAEQANLFDRYLAGPGLVYVSVDDTVHAYNRRSGAEAFTVHLADQFQHSVCADCMQLLGPDRDTLVTLTADGTLAAWDAEDGTARWSVRLHEATRQILDIDGNPGVIDREPDQDPMVFVHDATTGTVVAALAVACPGDTFGPDALGVYDYVTPIGGGSFVWIGTSPSVACAQRWDPGALTATWTTPLPEGGTNIPYDPEDFVVAEGRLLVVQGDTVLSYELATGTPSTFVVPETDLSPIGARDGVVALQATSTRGTARTSILALDLATGNTKWTFQPEDPPIGATSDLFVTGAGWIAGFVDGGLSVVQYRDEPAELVYQVIPLATGTASAPATVGLGDEDYLSRPSFFGYVGDRLLLAIATEVQVVDPASGEVVDRAP